MEQRETDAEARPPHRPPGPGLAASPQPLGFAITLYPSCGAPFYSQGDLRDYLSLQPYNPPGKQSKTELGFNPAPALAMCF